MSVDPSMTVRCQSPQGGLTHVARKYWAATETLCGMALTGMRLVKGGPECPTCAAIGSDAPKFQFALIDPPWKWQARSAKGEGRSPKYLRQHLDWLKRLDVPSILDRDAMVGMWVIDPMLPHALELAEVWGLKYSSVLFYWAKTRRNSDPHDLIYEAASWHMGNGYGTRANPEQCLLFKRGKGLRRVSARERRLIIAPVQEHSRKPDEAYARCERLWGNVSRIDVFARRQRPGWAVFGDEVQSSVSIHVRE